MSGPDQTPQKPDDRELEDFLAGRGQVREAYRAASQEKSPAALDDAILKMAAQALAEPPAPAKRVTRRWPGSLAAAAVLVLSFTVFVQVNRDPAARKAAFAPIAADAVPAAEEPAESLAIERVKSRKSAADAEQAQRRHELKQESMRAAAAAASRAESQAEKRAADIAAQPLRKPEVDAFAKDESESHGDMLRDMAEPAPPAAAMTAKSLRAAPAARMAESSAPTVAAPAPMPAPAAPPATGIEQQIDHWLKTCTMDSELAALGRDERGLFKSSQQWHGLSVTGFADGALLFAPNISREAITAQLNQVDPRLSQCLSPAPSGHAMQLRCVCLKP